MIKPGLDFHEKYNDLLLNWYYFLEIWPGKIHSEANKILVHSTENQYGLRNLGQTLGRTEVRFAKFLSGRFITAIVVNPLERKLAKNISVYCGAQCYSLI